jgi:hypothetical protein
MSDIQPFTADEFRDWLAAERKRSAEYSITHYKPPGPVAESYILDKRKVSAIMGPPGSGKTTATIFKLIRFSVNNPPCRDGVIRVKGMVVRDTFRNLYKTTISSWLSWFPLSQYPDFTGGSDRPAQHILRFVVPGRKSTITGADQEIDLIVEFTAIGENSVEAISRGWEGNWAWNSEANYNTSDALDAMRQRTFAGRYPPAKDRFPGVNVPALVVNDFNAPEETNWTVERLIEGDPAHVGFFRQPGARSPHAENLQNLNAGYYDELIIGMPKWKVRRDIDNLVGIDRNGMPVYEDYDDDLHRSQVDIPPVAGVPIDLGFDQGLHPACIITQTMPNGQLRVLEEVVPERMGRDRFAEMLMTVLEERYTECPFRYTEADPNAFHGADKEGGEQSWADSIGMALGKPLAPAATNEIGVRLSAVEQALMGVVPGVPNQRMLLINGPRCPVLIAGFQSKYRWQTDRQGNLINNQKVPVKDRFSNPHDALQYVLLKLRGRWGIVKAAAAGRRIGPANEDGGATVLKGDFNVFSV